MSAFESLALDAMAFQLVAALETYEQQVDDMVDSWLDMDKYREVSERVEEIRRYSSALPQLRSHWVELLIAHAELVHSLWRLRFQDDDEDRARLQQVRVRHAACLASLLSRCLRLISRSGSPSTTR